MLYAITSHGQKKWEARFGAPIVAPVALGADRTIYLQCEDDTMYAVSPEDGSIRWFFHRSGGTAPPVVGIDGTVFVCQDDTLFALEPGAGMVKWRFAMPQVIATPPAIDTGRGSIYVCDEDGNFVSVDLTDGTENWRQVPGSDPSAAVVGPDHTIYVCGGGRLFAFSDNGGSNWIFTPPMAGLASTPAISADGRVYILIVADKKDRRLGSDTLYAVNTVDGTRRWGCGLGSGSSDVPSAPKIDAEGYVYVADGMCGWCVVGSGGPAASPWPMYQHDFQNTGRAQ
jgi:outer membrane protein assembly factor BamB